MPTPSTAHRGHTQAGSRRLRAGRPARHRPPPAVRALVGFAGLAALLFAGLLLLSDRAPGLLRSVFGERIRQLWDRIDANGRTDVVTNVVRPETDFVVHVVIWAVVTFLIGLAVWSWLGLASITAGVFAVSVITELAQGVWSSTRAVELSDAAANGAGVAVGCSAAALVYLAWSGVAALFARPR